MKFQKVNLDEFMNNYQNLHEPKLAEHFGDNYRGVSELWHMVLEYMVTDFKEQFELCEHHAHQSAFKMVAMGYIAENTGYVYEDTTSSQIYHNYINGVDVVKMDYEEVLWLEDQLTHNEYLAMYPRIGQSVPE